MTIQTSLFDVQPPAPHPTPQRVFDQPESTLAELSSICPLCSKFIAKNHSWVCRLPYPIYPRSSPDGRQSLDDRGYYYASARPIRFYKRVWAHHYCWSRFDRPPRYEALQVEDYWGDFYRLIDRRDENFHYLYRFFGRSNELLYVGITHDFQQRLNQHYQHRPSEQLNQIDRITTQKYATREKVIKAEHEAIQTESPLWNIVR